MRRFAAVPCVLMDIFQKRHQLFAENEVIIRASEPPAATELLKCHAADGAHFLVRSGFARTSRFRGLTDEGFREFGNIFFGFFFRRLFKKRLCVIVAQVVLLPVTVLVNVGDMVGDCLGAAFTLHASAHAPLADTICSDFAIRTLYVPDVKIFQIRFGTSKRIVHSGNHFESEAKMDLSLIQAS